MSSISKLILVLLLLVLPLAGACETNDDSTQATSIEKGLDLIEEVWRSVDNEFVDSQLLQADELTDGAIRGLLRALDDPYTSYFNAEQYKDWQIDLEGEFTGIGVTITITDGYLTVIAPFAGSPAEQSGIRPGDRILKVDGESTLDMSLDEARMRIIGEKNTKVLLSVLHRDEESPVDIEIIRDDIEVPSVEWDMLTDGIAHISIYTFSDRTGEELTDALESAKAQGVTGIVLDLRDNPGGIVDAAVNVVDQFNGEDLVLYTVDNEGTRKDWAADDSDLAEDIPMAILVNGNSASASEIVAGALQDAGRGPIIGEPTFGKGSAQIIHPLSNGGAVKITYAKWFTPNGHQIDHQGIEPDILVELTTEDLENGRDPQLERAVEYLQEAAAQVL